MREGFIKPSRILALTEKAITNHFIYHPFQWTGDIKKSPFQLRNGDFIEKNSAATYSPTKSPWQYHRR
jgi:hypothetical protein